PSLLVSSATVVDPPLRAYLEGLGVSNIPAVPEGSAGNLTINSPSLRVTDGAQVTVRNDGLGDAGTLTANVQSLEVRNRAGITASTQQGSGGNIRVEAQEVVLLREGAQLSAEARGTGDGGNIFLNSASLIALENSDIIANAEAGSGGNIRIGSQSILGTQFREQLTPESDITASSEFGVSGIVNIENSATAPESGLVKLPDTVADPDSEIVAGCADTQGQFVASGRGGLPPGPTQMVLHHQPWRDLRAIARPSVSSNRTSTNHVAETNHIRPDTQSTASASMREAIRWQTDSQGRTILLASDTTAPSIDTPTCLSSGLTPN
ncbi:MAG: S-layer family protein, partial [Cyanobacteria bacterium J06632_3]